MFTGIIEETGALRSMIKTPASCVLQIGAALIPSGSWQGDSIAVNGVCLTVTSLSQDSFKADVMHETMARSCLGDLKTGSLVNLERAMAADGRFGGHIVSGHIDGTGTISMIRQDGNAVWYTVEAPPGILLYIVEKGSIAMDGISLTVARVTDHDFSVSVIPHTIRHTTLGAKRAGDRVNLENDCVGKYIGKLLGASSFSQDKVSRAGFTGPGGPQPNISRAGISQSHCAGTITRDFLTKYGF